MSCQVQVVGNINDLETIGRCLFPIDDQRGSDSWLQLCEVSVSPVSDLIVLAYERKIVVLTSKWNFNSSLNQFEISHSGTINDYDKVKAVLCLPIVEQSGKTIIGPDWTCILVAFDSGFVRFYTENCQLLFEEQFHNENITNVMCQSQHGPRPDICLNLKTEEIYIQYQSVMVILNGVEIFSVLRNCRNQLAKDGFINIPQPQLNPKKWGFTDQSVIHDSAMVGLNLSSSFDHLLTASTSGGFETKYRAMPPHSTLVLAVGSKPFLGYHYALEGASQPVLSDVAKVVATKLKSALPTWLTGSKSQTEKQLSIAMQPADNLGCRFGLCDLRRIATNIYLSPDHKLAAICDALGRVLIVDSFSGVILRIFKGYRDAQCSFIQAPEEKKTKHKIGNKVAHFLVIYSPKKGTVEVFCVQQGSKVVAFTASKYSRLFYITYGLMGFTTTVKSKYVCAYNTVLIDNDGQIKEILVPFHFAVCEKNNDRVRDIHMFKKLKHFIKSQESEEEKLLTVTHDTCTELQTLEMKTQTLDMLLSSKNIPATVILKCVQYFIDNLNGEDSLNFKLFCNNVNSIIKLYWFISESIRINTSNKENRNYETMKNITLNLQVKDMKNLQKLLDLSTLNDNNKLPEVHVSFSNAKQYSPNDFLSSFDLTSTTSITLKRNLDSKSLFRTSEIIFKPYITGELTNFKELESEIEKSGISTRSMFDMLVSYWVNRSLYINLNLEKEMNNLSVIIYILAKNATQEVLSTEYNAVSLFWSEIRAVLANSSRPFPALMAATLCRNVAQKMDSEMQMNDSSTYLDDDTMEVLSQENIEWSILIGKLEDISLLNIMLTTKPAVKVPALPKLTQSKADISLKYVLEKGKGSVSELVARWLSTTGINPQYIVLGNLEDNDNSFSHEHSNEHKIMEQLTLIKESFPYSLESSTLLSNMAWEYALAWQNEIETLDNLEAAMKCLCLIENVQIKQGLFQLIWNTHLKIVNESTCKLINKVGKLPKERLCKQDTGLTDFQIAMFLNISSEFLDKFIDVTQESYQVSKSTLQFENIWDNGKQSLVELAAQQKEVNFDLLSLHYQLILVLHFMATFFIKHAKPVISLFEASVVNLFFTDLQRKIEISWSKSDIKINASRIQFLYKIISASLETITINESGKVFSTEHVSCMSKCITLGRFWNLDIDILRRYQIVRLYSNGYDTLAQELIPAVTDRNDLGKQLLKIGASRLSHYLAVSADLPQTVTALSPSLSNYMVNLKLDEEEKDNWCAPSSINALTDLTSHAINCLFEDHQEYKLALLLLDACRNLEQESVKN